MEEKNSKQLENSTDLLKILDVSGVHTETARRAEGQNFRIFVDVAKHAAMANQKNFGSRIFFHSKHSKLYRKQGL